MAVVHPEDITGFEEATDGEIRVHRFLREAAKPDRDFLAWYSPFIGVEGKAPDFVLFGKDLGLLVLEVKDWSLPQIRTANYHQFTLRISGRDEPRTNPDKQAKGYVDALMGRLRTVRGFLSDEAGFEGKLKIPVGRMVAFPNILRQDFLTKDPLPLIIPPERVLFQDDLDPGGRILADASGQAFRQLIAPSFPFKLRQFKPRDVVKLHHHLWPEFLQLPPRLGEGKAHFQREVQALDESQARLARSFGKGHQIVKGPPGSGKTLVLVHRCHQLARYHPSAKRILLVCFNIALASYLKRLLQEKGLGVGRGGVEVHAFYDLCAEVLGEKIDHSHPDSEYYHLVTQMALDAVRDQGHRFGLVDAVIVDEGQDFSDDMLKVLLGLLAPNGDLFIALDAYQDLYRRNSSWKSLGIAARGRTHYLENAYRSTAEIFEFTQRFIEATPRKRAQGGCLPLDFAFHGDPPRLLRFRDFTEIENFLSADIQERIDTKDYKRSEIAVIYDDKTYGPETFTYDRREVPNRLRQTFEHAGIPVNWVSEDVRAKEMFDITTDRVSLVSIHSAKGLDFDLVYFVGADQIRPAEKTRLRLTRLIYVALTRAKHRLIIPYVEETELIGKMRACLAP